MSEQSFIKLTELADQLEGVLSDLSHKGMKDEILYKTIEKVAKQLNRHEWVSILKHDDIWNNTDS